MVRCVDNQEEMIMELFDPEKYLLAHNGQAFLMATRSRNVVTGMAENHTALLCRVTSVVDGDYCGEFFFSMEEAGSRHFDAADLRELTDAEKRSVDKVQREKGAKLLFS